MFTGIVTAIGTIESVEQRGDLRVVVAARWIRRHRHRRLDRVFGRVPDRGRRGGTQATHGSGSMFGRDGQPHRARHVGEGAKLNLEPALRLGDELGGHLVTGHVDTVGEVVCQQEGGCWPSPSRAPRFAPFVAEKGSITVDGVSLTVNDVRDRADGTAIHSTSSPTPPR